MIKPSFYSFFLFCFLTSFFSSAQEQPFDAMSAVQKYTISPPDVYNFEKVSLSNINHYVGKANINIPIYTIQTGNITYPISLMYDTGGIKVDQLASNVGLGWSLSKTVITRTVNQDNDFNNLGHNYLDTNSHQVPLNDPYYYNYAPGELQKQDEVRNQSLGNIGYFLAKRRNVKINGYRKSVDFIPDTYNFYTNNFSTNFFFLDPLTPVEINPKGTLITAVRGKQTFDTSIVQISYSGNTTPYYNFPTQDFFSITILTNKGIKYVFNNYDLTVNYTRRLEKDYFPPAQISAWHISEITDINTGKTITFEYETYSSNPYEGSQNFISAEKREVIKKAAQKSYNYTKLPNDLASTCSYYFNDDDLTHNLSQSERIDVRLNRLKAINFEEGKILYHYNGQDPSDPFLGGARKDVYNGDFLTRIEIKDKNMKTINSFDLNYDYFQSNYGVGEFDPNNSPNFNDYRYKRLKLTSVKEAGKPAYKFTYDESIKLPPVNSFSVDFLGYFNNSPDVTDLNHITSIKPNPRLYYYPNKYELSLLPFPVANTTYHTINGYFNREANSFAKAWTLTKIEYPTGGTSEYVYEPNDFEVFEKSIIGGGVRITKQLLKDDFGNTRTVDYSYKKDATMTSGRMSSMPFFGHPTRKFFEVYSDPYDSTLLTPGGTSSNVVDWKIFDKSNLQEDITSGAYVGYSVVTEKELGNGYKQLKFTSNEESNYRDLIERNEQNNPAQTELSNSNNCIANFLILNSGIGANIFTDNSYKRGKLLEENIFDENDQPLEKTTITYTTINTGVYGFLQPISQPIFSYNVESNTVNLLSSQKAFHISKFLPASRFVYKYDGLNGYRDSNMQYTYNLNGTVKTSLTRDSYDVDILTRFYYANDVVNVNSLLGGSLSTSELNALLRMKGPSFNNTSEPIQIETVDEINFKSRVRKNYKIWALGAVNSVALTSIKEAVDTHPLEEKLTLHLHDEKSNTLEFSRQGGPKTALIWGYNKTKIIARIENAAYSSINATTILNLQAISNNEYTETSENSLRVALNDLRNTLKVSLPNSVVTTYTYDPLVGVKSITDARGKSVFYNYDSNNRLQYVKDNEGNLLSRNEYNYQQ